MNRKNIAMIIGIFVLGLGVIGLLFGEQRFADSINMNIVLDLARIVLGGYLVYAARETRNAKNALVLFGVVYLGMFLLGLVSNNMFGLLPDGLGALDHLLHFGGGVLALVAAYALSDTRIERVSHT